MRSAMLLGLGFQELARQSADKVWLILEKEIEWVERFSSLLELRESVREGPDSRSTRRFFSGGRNRNGRIFDH